MRIVSLQPSVSIVLERLGCLDQLVACTRYCVEALPELAERGIPVVADSWSTKAEELLPIEADLVIASVPYRQESLAAILKAGTPVLALAPHSLSDIYQDIRLIASMAGAGSIAGAADLVKRGERVVAAVQAEVESVRRRAAEAEERPLVYCEEWGKPLIHSQAWVRELVEAAGGRFLGDPGAVTTSEAIAAADPAAMVFAWCGAGNRVPLERTIEKRGWSGLRAAREGRVWAVPDEWLNTPAPTLTQGLHALAAVIHPEIFGTATTMCGLRCKQSIVDTSKME